MTIRDLEFLVATVNKKLEYIGRPKLYIRSGYNKYGLSQVGTDNYVSLLGTLKETVYWLEAFEQGVDYASV